MSGNDLLQFCHGDDRTEVVLLYLESFGTPRKFARLARVDRTSSMAPGDSRFPATLMASAAFWTALPIRALDHQRAVRTGTCSPARPCVCGTGFDISDQVWSMIGFFAQGRLLAAPRGGASQLKCVSGRALPCPTPPVTVPTKPLTTQAERPSHRRPRHHPADQDVDSRLHLQRCLQPQVQRRSTPVQQRSRSPRTPPLTTPSPWGISAAHKWGKAASERQGRLGTPQRKQAIDFWNPLGRIAAWLSGAS